MEIWAFLGIVFAGILYLVWRTRRGTSRGPDALNRGLPHDLRDKNEGGR